MKMDKDKSDTEVRAMRFIINIWKDIREDPIAEGFIIFSLVVLVYLVLIKFSIIG